MLDAQKKAIEKVKPGRTVHELDKKARKYIKEKEFGEYFIHRTGHGLGLEVHERPFIREGNNLKVKSGMVFTIEPGIYLPEEFGVRIEDNIVVTDEGYENLATLDHDIVKK